MPENYLKEAVIDQLKTVFDPEIPVSIWELGLVYDVKISEENNVNITMTLTAPGCPVADQLLEEVREKAALVPEINEASVELTFSPTWDPDMMSEEAKLELGFM